MLNLYKLGDAPEYRNLAKNIRDGVNPISVFGVSDSAKAHFAASLAEDRPILFVTQGFLRAEKIKNDIEFFASEKVVVFPERDFLMQAQMQSGPIQQKRIEALDKILNGARIVIAPIEAVLFNIMPPEALEELKITLKVGETVQMRTLCQKLVTNGYSSAEQLEGQGQFFLHGGIIDIFPFGSENSVRVDFFDDEIESIRLVDPVSQRTQERIDKIEILPSRETCANAQKLASAGELLSKELVLFNKGNKNSAAVEEATNTFALAAQTLCEGGYPSICDQLMAYVYPEYTCLLDYMPANTLVFFDEVKVQAERGQNLEVEFNKNITDLLALGKVLSRHSLVFTGFDRFWKKALSRQVVSLQTISGTLPFNDAKAIFRIDSRPMQAFHGKPEFLLQEVKLYQAADYKIVLCAQTKARYERLEKEFTSAGISVIPLKHGVVGIENGQIALINGTCVKGFDYPQFKLAIIAENDIFQSTRLSSNAKTSKKSSMDTFVQLSIGDAVVHETNGIGIYQGIVKIETDKVKRDYLFIKYRDDDKLYVPVEQMHRVQKYIAPDSAPPKLNKLGSSEWVKTKTRVKKAIADMADKLIEIYKKRELARGIQFLPDTPWQRELEDDFPFEETDDQLKCIKEIKEDMESGKAMDRLLCGDVGYGKTEVALRAAFKAVMSGYQVAVLAPTTILAQQHFNTFCSRMSNFSAVRIEVLSRFKTAKEQKKTLEALKEGRVDILIGTHRLLAKDVEYKNLGLLIVDEEQRFGVAHKEKIKGLKANIDVLTLSATPIPRTLNMALSGIRDMSVLETPPAERYPVQTYVVEYSDSLVRDAIMRELARGGQVYYLYNRVQDIDLFALKLQKLVPQARIAIGHGQMDEKQLEKVMLDFCNGDFDVLLCTTIIENGVDIPGANTLIVQNADRFGLSQLYQLRGRVGRSNRSAFAYFTTPPARSLSEDAHKRLMAIEEFTQMGSGFKIAMRDLEIRGAGNLLGGEQHGHMSKIGYDLYCKMIKETVDENLGKAKKERLQTSIELKMDAYISEEYIPSESVRFAFYRKISEIVSKDEYFDICEEMKDRFGKLPLCTESLLKIAYIRAMMSDIGVSVLKEAQGNVILNFVDPTLEKMMAAVSEFEGFAYLNAGRVLSLTLNVSQFKQSEKLDKIIEFAEFFLTL